MVELLTKVILGTTTSFKLPAAVTVRMVESARLVVTVPTGLLPLALLPTPFASASAQMLLAISTTAAVLAVSLSVRLPVPDNLYTTEILMQ